MKKTKKIIAWAIIDKKENTIDSIYMTRSNARENILYPEEIIRKVEVKIIK